MCTPTTSLNRKYYLDYLRIFSMFMVVLIHVIGSTFFRSENVTSSLWFRLNLIESGIRWSVPVFVMISGALFLDPQKELTPKKIWSKYIRRIVTAFLFWSVIYAGIDLLQHPRNLDLLHQCADLAITVLLKPTDHLWFVYMIVGLYIITPVLRKVVAASNKRELQYWLVIMFLLGLLPEFLRNIPIIEQYFGEAIESAHLSFLCGYAFYYVAGYYFSQYRPKFEAVFYMVGILGYLGTAFFTWKLSIKNGVATTVYDYLFPNTAAIAIGIYVFFVVRIGKLSESCNGARWIKPVSNSMFGVYLCHVLFITAIDWLVPEAQVITGIGQALLKTMFVFTISLASVMLLRKVRVLREHIL